MLVRLTLLPSVVVCGEGVDGDSVEGVEGDSREGLDGNSGVDVWVESGVVVEGDSGEDVEGDSGEEGWPGESVTVVAVSSVRLAVNVDTAAGVVAKVTSPLDPPSIPVSSPSVGDERVCSSGGGCVPPKCSSGGGEVPWVGSWGG